MELALIVYAIGILPEIMNLLGFISIFCFMLIFLTGLFCTLDGSSPVKFMNNHKWFTGIFGFIMVFSVIGATIIPSEKTMYMMAGAYATQQVYQSDDARRIGTKVVSVIENKLNDYLEESDKPPNKESNQ